MPALPDSICGWRPVALSVAMLFTSVALGRSEDAVFAARHQVIVECQVVFLPQKMALPLIPELSDEATIDAAWTRVETLIARGEAKLVANLFGRSEEGKRVIVQTEEELHYPTEFEQTLPPLTTPKEKAADALKHWPFIGICSTAFETRNLGWSLELESATSSNAGWIHIRGRLAAAWLSRFSKELTGTLPSGQELSVPQPQFDSIVEVLDFRVRAGQRVLVSTHKVQDAENTMALGVMRVRVLRKGGGE